MSVGSKSKKVFPSSSISMEKGLNDPIDVIVRRVEEDLKKMTSFADDRTKYTFGQQMVGPHKSLVEEPLERHRMKNSPSTRHLATSGSFSSLESDAEADDIKMSHQVFQENQLAGELNDGFKNLKTQVESYRNLYLKANENYKNAERKLKELQEQMALKEQDDIDNKSSLLVNAGPNRRVFDGELNARSEQLRKALLFDNEDDEAITLNDVFKSDNWFVAFYEYTIVLLVPFKRHLRQIQAKFGSSVASYFMFYRFL